MLIVGLGGGLGATLRYLVTLWIPGGAIPDAILLINALGSFLIGLLMALSDEFGVVSPTGRLFVGVGMLGGFTTFSTYIEGVYQLLRGQRIIGAYGYAIGSLLLGLVGAWLGLVAVRQLFVLLRQAPETVEGEE